MASILLDKFRTDHDPDKPRKKVPKVAFYVLGAAAAKLAAAAPSTTQALPSRSIRSIAAGASTSGATGAAIEDTALRNSKPWKASEEFKLYGPEGRQPGAPGMGNMLWMGIKALGIATGMVGVGAGLGVIATARWMGVTTLEEFSSKMRETVASNMPELAEISRAAQLESALDEHGNPREKPWHDFLDGPDDRPS